MIHTPSFPRLICHHGGSRLAGCVLGLAASGCIVSAGPQVGITFEGQPTLGWELSAASFSLGQSYRLGRDMTVSSNPPAKGPWQMRTYLVWEPRVGGILGSTSSGFGVAGSGGTIGMRWDWRENVVDGKAVRVTDFNVIGGAWGGGAYVLPPRSTPSCEGGDGRWFVSLALGFRGNELYLTPKYGTVQMPQFCFFNFGHP